MTATDNAAAEQVYRQALAALSEGVVVQDKDGTITSCNPAAERILGLTAEQMQGRTSVDPRWRAVHEDGSPFPGEEHPALVTLRTRTPLEGVIMGVHKPDGSLSWISINSMPFHAGSDDAGEDAVVTTFTDITARRAAEARLRESEERFQAAIGSMRDAVAIQSPVHDGNGEIVDFRYDYVNDALCELIGRNREEILTRLADEVHPGWARSERFELYRQVARTGTPFRSEDYQPEQAWGTEFARRVIETVVARAGEQLVVSARDVTERRRAEAQLAASEARFHDVIESAPDAMVVVDADGEIQLVSARTETLFGYTREELIGQNHEVLVPELLRDRHREHRAHYAAHPRVRAMGEGLELFARRKDGSEFPVEISLSPLGDENQTLICAAIRDVTARRAAEQELALHAELLDLAHDAVIVREPSQSRVSFWNREAQAMYGYSTAEAIGRVTHELLATVFPDSREAVDEALARDGHWHGEVRHRREDGSEILVSSRQAMQRDANGRALAIIELNSDITAQRQVEDELRDSRAQLAEAERVARIGSWQWDLANNHLICSAGLLDIYGLTPDEFAAGFEGINQRVYPDDRELVSRALQCAIAERSSFTADYRVIRSDGRVRTVRCYGEIVVDQTGQPSRAIGIVQDITDAKLAQEALQSTSAELARRANELQQLELRNAPEPPDTPHAPLTARQLEIMRLVAQGLTNAAIGERLFLTEGTVKWHLRQIMVKTNSRNRAEAIARVLGTTQ